MQPSPPHTFYLRLILLIHFPSRAYDVHCVSFSGEDTFGAIPLERHLSSLREFVVKCGMVGDAWIASLGAKSLAEERKEQLEQLPPPLEILDPPFG